ncbi:hypothetical protein D3C71_1093290 [compost metagenome]
MPEEGPVALGLALLGPAQHGVDLIDGLGRQQAAQEHHRVTDRGQVGLEVAARHAEQVRHIATAGEHGLGTQALAIVDQGDDAGREAVLAEHPPDQVRTALTVKHGVEQFDAAHRVVAPMRQVVLQAHGDGRRAAQLVGIGHLETVVAEYPHERLCRPGGREGVAVPRDRVGDGIGGLHVHGHELDRRIHALGGEQAPGQGVVEGLVQLGVDQPVQQQRIGVAYLQPQRARADGLTGRAPQCIHGLRDALVVQPDAFDRIGACTGPVAGFESVPGAPGNGGKARVIVLEAITDQDRQRGGQGVMTRGVGGNHAIEPEGPAITIRQPLGRG